MFRTFQEYIVAPRRLIFHHQTVSWACQGATTQENGIEPDASLILIDLPRVLAPRMWTSWPNLHTYQSMVEYFSSRTLSKSDDVLNAFEAIMNVQGRTMKGGILYGLPELFFSAAFLWTPPFKHKLRRRTDEKGAILLDVPSWSWAGWMGPIASDLVKQGLRYFEQLPSDPAKREYYRRENARSALTSYHDIDFYKVSHTGASALIQDLHHHPAEGDLKGMNKRMNGYEFTRSIPLVDDPEEVIVRQDRLYSPILHFHTHRLRASIARHDKHGIQTKRPVVLGSNGNAIGFLNVALALLDEDLPSAPVDFISLGRMEALWSSHTELALWGSFNTDAVEYWHAGCKYDCRGKDDKSKCEVWKDGKFRWHNVLWVEWQDGVAYRKAIGKIWWDEWDREGAEGVDVRLG